MSIQALRSLLPRGVNKRLRAKYDRKLQQDADKIYYIWDPCTRALYENSIELKKICRHQDYVWDLKRACNDMPHVRQFAGSSYLCAYPFWWQKRECTKPIKGKEKSYRFYAICSEKSFPYPNPEEDGSIALYNSEGEHIAFLENDDQIYPVDDEKITQQKEAITKLKRELKNTLDKLVALEDKAEKAYSNAKMKLLEDTWYTELTEFTELTELEEAYPFNPIMGHCVKEASGLDIDYWACCTKESFPNPVPEKDGSIDLFNFEGEHIAAFIDSVVYSVTEE